MLRNVDVERGNVHGTCFYENRCTWMSAPAFTEWMLTSFCLIYHEHCHVARLLMLAPAAHFLPHRSVNFVSMIPLLSERLIKNGLTLLTYSQH
jgi:hypothetical protein